MGEPQLKYRKISIIDGNSSLQRVDRHASASKDSFESDYFLSANEVNGIENLGASHQVHSGLAHLHLHLLTPNTKADGFDQSVQDASTEHCVRNWRAALPDNLKSMFSKFDETGIFVAVCRHGFILTCVDMIRSGEL